MFTFDVVSGGIGTGPGVIPLDPFTPGFLDGPRGGAGGRGRGFVSQLGGGRRGVGGMGGGAPAMFTMPERPGQRSSENKPSHAKSDRERHHDDDDDDYYSPPSSSSLQNGGGGGRGGGGFYGGGNRGYHNNRGGGGGGGAGYQPRGGAVGGGGGGFGNFGGQQQYNRSVSVICDAPVHVHVHDMSCSA